MDLFGMAQLTIPATDPDLVLPKRMKPIGKLPRNGGFGVIFLDVHADILWNLKLLKTNFFKQKIITSL